MNKFLIGLLAVGIFSSQSYYGSSLAPVVIAGSIIKAKHESENTQKYKRKDCPVCKGKGWYMSGDGIKRIECSYCEPENKLSLSGSIPAPSAPGSNCPNGKCPTNRK